MSSASSGSINYASARFKAAYRNPRALPPSTTPEVSFLGRSNVGKSSLINRLFGKKGLAKVSSTPGKTASVNFYEVDGISFVDLPGYGFAQVNNTERQTYSILIAAYFEGERSHNLAVQLVDIRHDPSILDRETTATLRERAIPFVVALTKADKLSRAKAHNQRTAIAKQLDLDPEQLIITSAKDGTGIRDLKRAIASACL